MSDVSGPLTAAVAIALRSDPGVIAAFGAKTVQVFDIVPTNAAEPYLQLPGAATEPLPAEGFDLSTVPYAVHVWSRPNPPGLAEAYALAAAVRAVLPTVTLAGGGRIYAAEIGRTEAPLGDPTDPRLVHIVVTATFTTAPA